MAVPQSSTVLIVDDDKGLARVMAKMLQRDGIVATSAYSGEETLLQLEKEVPALMLLDLQLGDFNAKELIERLEGAGLTVPFIIITGQGDERVAADMMKRGALDYLVKDVQFLELVPTVVRNALTHLDNKNRLAVAEKDRRRLEKEILEICEREQRRIGQDLHDDLGQQIAGLWCLSQVLEDNLKAQQSPEAEAASKMTGLLKGALALTRSLAKGLHPVSVKSGGLTAALNDLTQRVSDTFRIECRYKCHTAVAIDDNVATQLYRIAQEAVTNAIKHGKAKMIDIELSANPFQMVLSVRDQGVGLPLSDPEGKGMGMRIMRYRAGVIGGVLQVLNDLSGQGTVVSCTVPGSESAEEPLDVRQMPGCSQPLAEE
ncbi:MAG: response regulator [Prosthecobacter sp.]|nr:response regulator [Prosthecobacter sp.]